MSENTAISWTDATWTTVTGCERVSPGCARCYSERLTATRLSESPKYKGLAVISNGGEPHWTGEIRLHPECLEQPLHWRKPRRIFVNSMSDTFHRDVPDSFIASIFAVMESCPQHTFQVLTKRAERMQALLSHDSFPMYVRKMGWDAIGAQHYRERGPFWRDNVWVGVSVEDQQRADERIPLLLRTPAAVRFLSCEPLLSPIDLRFWDPRNPRSEGEWMASVEDVGVTGKNRPVDLVIVGGESGPDRRPCEVEWIASIVEQCRAAGVSCWIKQDSHRLPGQQGRIPDEIWKIKEMPA